MIKQLQYLKSRNINYIYHATPIENLESIIKSKGIFSVEQLNNNNEKI